VPDSEFLISDPLWFESLENLADGPDRFTTAELDPPAGWVRGQFDGWVAWHPAGLELPEQGWKIHVSARISEADEVIGIVRDYCVTQGIAFKFLRSRTICLTRNEKYAPRSGSGKLLALYPVEDAQLENALRDLSAALAGRAGPYILSDLRWGPGPLYLRYGGFLPRHCVSPDTGLLVPAVREPGGTLVPDVRAPVFRVPEWAPVPGFIAAQIEAARAGRSGDALPYRVQEVIHYSNGGGIYRAADPETGAPVVLREARPHAGLDATGTDAVTRLQRERATLERLAGLGCVPAVLGSFTCWEHHYLVEEYIEGQVLQHAIAARYPLTSPNPPDSEIAEYARWAMTILDQVERALDDVHARGVVFGDLHPFNVIVRPDGRIALIDFEEASDISEQRRAAMGAPGYVPPWPATGTEIDAYALNCLKLAMFLPVTQLLSLDPDRVPDLAAVAARRFGLPSGFCDRLVSALAPPAGWDRARWLARRPGLATGAGLALVPGAAAGNAMAGGAGPEPEQFRASMITAILASATPDRADRLFPGDRRLFAEGGVSIAHGAAGVLYALDIAGAPVPPEHADWLARAARRWPMPLPGAYGGLDGTAAVLAMLGRAEDALAVSGRVSAARQQVRRVGLHDGLGGAGLALLRLADLTGDQASAQEAEGIGERLARAVRDPEAAGVIAGQAGLRDGWTAAAALFLDLHERAGGDSWLNAAEAALRLDLAQCVPAKAGGLQVHDGFRTILYLATGSSGIALVIQELLARRPCPDLAGAMDGIRGEFGAEFVLQPGLFEGRAGIALASAALGGDGTGAARQHLRRLAWHALSYRGGTAFPGSGLIRLSMDLATGTAGVLLASCAADAGGRAGLPLLDFGRGAHMLPAAPAAGPEKAELAMGVIT
jgi:hypothetical protein